MKKLLGWLFIFCLFMFIVLWVTPISPDSLGDPDLGKTTKTELIKEWHDHKSSLKIYDLVGNHFRGKMMLVKLADSKQIQVGLAKQGLGTVETTSSMAKRAGAIAAINGGGFFNKSEFKEFEDHPIYITISNGRLISSAPKVSRATALIGLTKTGQFIYDDTSPPEKLLKMGVWQGVSFTPLLIKDGQKLPVRKFQRDPRTAIGLQEDGTFIFIVIDGRRKNWSQGVTLEELQGILLQNKAWIAANLDGGGSSTIVFNGRVLNRPSDLWGERSIATSILILPAEE